MHRYPPVSQVIFEGIACTELDDGEWWLVVDPQTRCSENGVSPMQYQCVVALILIPIGVPVFMFCQLYRKRVEIMTEGSVARNQYGFLVQDYEMKL